TAVLVVGEHGGLQMRAKWLGGSNIDPVKGQLQGGRDLGTGVRVAVARVVRCDQHEQAILCYDIFPFVTRYVIHSVSCWGWKARLDKTCHTECRTKHPQKSWNGACTNRKSF